jgi:hypothetical protein
LGLADAELSDVSGDLQGTFLDDNYDGTSTATAEATLNNSWAAKVNVLDPDNLAGTGLNLFQVGDDTSGAYSGNGGDPGLDSSAVRILMESDGSVDLIGVLNPLSNDDFGTRQYLYPMVIPEPGKCVFSSASSSRPVVCPKVVEAIVREIVTLRPWPISCFTGLRNQVLIRQ